MLDEFQIKYTVGKTWTTDAFYRETVDKIKRRKEQGCVCVDMECSANEAVSRFREKDRIAMIALELARRLNNDAAI